MAFRVQSRAPLAAPFSRNTRISIPFPSCAQHIDTPSASQGGEGFGPEGFFSNNNNYLVVSATHFPTKGPVWPHYWLKKRNRFWKILPYSGQAEALLYAAAWLFSPLTKRD